MRQAGEVTYADAHKSRRNEGLVDSSFICVCVISFWLLQVLLQSSGICLIFGHEKCNW